MAKSIEGEYQEITLGARDIIVRFLDPWTGEDPGEWLEEQDMILVRGDRSQAYENDTLIHELLHALLSISGYRFDDTEEEEAFVRQLTPWLHTLIVQNPDLMQSLAAGERVGTGDSSDS
jgi:predicted DNA-binding transcriptional regulator YafY